MEDFIVGLTFMVKEERYFVTLDLSWYIDEKKQTFDKKSFMTRFHILTQTQNRYVNYIIKGNNVKDARYLYFSHLPDSTKPLAFQNLLVDIYETEMKSSVFFLDGARYFITDKQKNIIPIYFKTEGESILSLDFPSNQTRFGKTSFYIDGENGEEIHYILYPSKIPFNYLPDIIKKVEDYYPNNLLEQIQDRFNLQKKIDREKYFCHICDYYVDEIDNTIEKKEIMVLKREYNPIFDKKTDKLKKLIKKTSFDDLNPDCELPIYVNELSYDTEKNRYILWGLLVLKFRYKTELFDSGIKTYIEKGVYKNNLNVNASQDEIYGILQGFKRSIPYEMMEEREDSKFLEIVNKCEKISGTHSSMSEDSEEYDSVKGLNDIYEVYCFIKFYEFLIQIGIDFADDLNSESIYDAESQILIKYQDYFSKGFITGSFHSRPCTLYFGDKIIPNHLRKYQLMLKSDFNFLDRAFKKASERDGLTPDITLEIGDELIICDVKFSCFKDRETQLDFPNFDRLLELQKYRKIFVKDSPYSKPIILFYPGSIKGDTRESSIPKPPTPMQRLENFKLMHALVLKSFQIFLFPILDDDDNSGLVKFLKEEFGKMLD